MNNEQFSDIIIKKTGSSHYFYEKKPNNFLVFKKKGIL